MNTANIKKYAPKARNNFIAAVTKQAARYGITAKGTEPMEQRGDIALIGENAFPKAIAPARKALERMVEQMGFAQAMEQAAYSWFNRLCAIRYMEVHDFLDHGRRVLSTANGEVGTPQILDDCLDISLPGLDPQQVAELKLDGNKDEELYRELLLAQCHALHEAMPFLFEAVDDATELLLPDNLTKTDSLIRELVSAIPEDDWQDVEIIGWLYQFYISEKKDQVIGKVVKSEDIPAATQLFTPNWIVQYLVQNSVGRQWLQTYPDSPLRNQMPYFIEPGEQPPEVQAQLDETLPDAIDPESIKVLDPACGSGHILVEAYKILKAIYEERGYRSRDIPQQILKHNLFGLDIDDRAGQLAGFALMMLAREDDRRLFSRVAEGDVTLNVLSLKETGHLNLPQLWQDLNLSGDWQQGSSQSLFESEQADLSSASADERYQLLQRTLERFVEAKTFGSLIEVPEEDSAPLKMLIDELEQLARTGDVMQKPAAEILLPYVRQAWALAQLYLVVVANPPYMGSGYFNKSFKSGLKGAYKLSRTDLYALFIERNFRFLKNSTSISSMVTRHDWMFTSSYSELRNKIVHESNLINLVHLGSGAFPTISGEVVQSVMFSCYPSHLIGYIQAFVDCTESEDKEYLFSLPNYRYFRQADYFPARMGSPILYQFNESELAALNSSICVDDAAILREGIHTGNNDRFIRFWWEVDFNRISFSPKGYEDIDNFNKKWVRYNKGGTTSRWYEPTDFVIAFDGESRKEMSKLKGHVRPSESIYFTEGGTWSDVATKGFGVRFFEKGHLFDGAGPVAVSENIEVVLAVMNSIPFRSLSGSVMPNLHFKCGTVKKMPYPNVSTENVELQEGVNLLIGLLKSHSRFFETFLSFEKSVWLRGNEEKLVHILNGCIAERSKAISRFHAVEHEINNIVSEGYNLDLSDYEDKTKDNIIIESRDVLSVTNLVSFIIGCILGRFSADEPGVILGSPQEVVDRYFEKVKSPRFNPDEDGILPLTDQEWFADDATNRLQEFIGVIWGERNLQENLDFVAENLFVSALKPKRGESALDTIRRYLSTQFYKDHLRMYKKRPIYWLFSSGKHKAFECLVYLHRYNEGTLARMRTEYVIPLSAKLNAYAEKLEQDKEASTSAAETKRLEKEIATLHKQQVELAEFDEKLRHYADQRISLDLDDGVKVNYGKFGDLLAEVKAVTGEKPQ